MRNSQRIHPYECTKDLHHSKSHQHEHTRTKVGFNRRACAIGHLQTLKDMAEWGDDRSEVLIQLAAACSPLNNTRKIILKDPLEHCLVDAIETGSPETTQHPNKAIDQFMK